jgi:flagellar L-ring protein precursor FlgH
MTNKFLPPHLKLHAARSFAVVVASALTALPLAAQAPATVRNAAAAPTTPATGAAVAPAVASATPATSAPALPVRESWISDRRTFAVGDIVTVLIDDYTISTAVKENVASDARTRNLGLSASLPSSSKNISLGTKNAATQDESGSAKRENRFQNEMSVRVVAVAPNGLLQLKGTKSINVDKNMQDIQLTGWVRAQDVTALNTVESARLADAQIGYASPGNLVKPKISLISKLLGAFWP